MIRYIISALFISLLSLSILAQRSPRADDLESTSVSNITNDVLRSVKICPITLAPGMTMTDIRFQENHFAIVFEYTYDTSLYPANVVAAEVNSDVYKSNVINGLISDPVFRSTLSQMGHIDCGIQVINKTLDGDVFASIFIPYADIATAMKDASNPKPQNDPASNFRAMDNYVQMFNSMCPQKADAVTVLTKAKRNGTEVYLCYEYLEGEAHSSAQALEGVKNILRANIEKMLSGTAISPLIKAVVDIDGTLNYQYTGSDSGYTFVITFTTDELRQALNK